MWIVCPVLIVILMWSWQTSPGSQIGITQTWATEPGILFWHKDFIHIKGTWECLGEVSKKYSFSELLRFFPNAHSVLWGVSWNHRSVLVSCLLCFGCSCWSVFGGAGIGKNLGNLGLYTLTLLKTKYLFLLSSSHTQKKCQTLLHINPRNQVLHSFTDYFEYTKKCM